MSTLNKYAATGSIAGFGEIDLSGDGTPEAIMPGNFSAAELTRRLLEIRRDLDPNELHRIMMMVQDHLQNLDNPHEVTLDAIITDVVKDMLEPFIPGTVPSTQPTFSFHALLSNLYPMTVTRNSEVTVIDVTGRLVTVPPNTLAIDYSEGHAQVSLWGEHRNLITCSNTVITSEGSGIFATLKSAIPSLKAPDGSNAYVVVSDTTDTTEHGYSITITPGSVGTTSAFIYPLVSSGYLVIAPTDSLTGTVAHDKSFTIDLSTKKIVEQGELAIPHIVQLVTGWMRVGLSSDYSAGQATDLHITYKPTLNDHVYEGTGLDLFAVFGLMHDEGEAMAPYIPTITGPQVLAPTTVQFSMSGINREQGIISAQFVYGGEAASPQRSLLQFGSAVTMEVDTQYHTFRIAALEGDDPYLPIRQECRTNEPITASLSYGPIVIKSKVTGTPVAEVEGSFLPLPNVTTVTLGSFPGYLRSIVIYPAQDDGRALDFLS